MQFNAPHHLFARCLHGTEDLVWDHIEQSYGGTLISTSHRTIFFESSSPLQSLLNVRVVDDLFSYVGSCEGITRHRHSLTRIAEATGTFPIEKGIERLQQQGVLSETGSGTVTASFLGTRNFTRWEIENAIRQGLRMPGEFQWLSHSDAIATQPDIHFRFHIEDEKGVLGIRVGKRPLYKRRQTTSQRPGALHPPLAALMVHLANPDSGSVLLDPCCGTGAINEEAIALDRGLRVIGVDRDDTSFLEERGLFLRGDSTKLPISSCSVNSIVTDLPWGGQATIQGGNEDVFLTETLAEMTRVGSSGGGIVILFRGRDGLTNVLRKIPALTVLHERTISLFGQAPTLFVLRKN